VALAVSHPCTTFDKWPLIPVVDADGAVTSFVRTFF
jgi:D-serine deaminase-like pyridoxal phosphate-dependent protein